MSFSAKQYFNFSTLRERLSCCCFNPADAEQLEKGNKQLGEILPPVYVDFYQTRLATSVEGKGGAKVGTGNANSSCQLSDCLRGKKVPRKYVVILDSQEAKAG